MTVEEVVMTCRVPRKLKKFYKKRWAMRMGKSFPTNRVIIKKRSICKINNPHSTEKVWSCEVSYKQKNKRS